LFLPAFAGDSAYTLKNNLDLKSTLTSILAFRDIELEDPMETLKFKQLPLAVKIAVGIAFLNAWVLIEQLVIDRYGIWKYMPGYKVTDPCVWDLTVAIIISIAIWRASTRQVAKTNAP